MKHIWTAAILGTAALMILAPTSSSASTSCESLKDLKLPDTTITSAAVVPAGSYTPPPRTVGGPGAKTPSYMMPAYCSVHLVVKPAINVEIWLPAQDWNGKTATVGDQGLAGYINYLDMIQPLKMGYVTASTDSGHPLGGTSPFDWGVGHPELVVDYGYRGIHEMTLKTKKIVEAFYGMPARLNYFIGCSNAGREALMEVQRYPNDYDGVLAGAPLVSWTKQMGLEETWHGLTLLTDPESNIPQNKMPALADAALAACDMNDGVKDGLITDPERCNFDPSVLLCKAGDSPDCLTAKQVEAVKKLYAGPIVNGKDLYPGYVRGSERNWVLVGTPPKFIGIFNLAQGFFMNMMNDGKPWDFRTWSYDKDWPALQKKWGGVLDADNSNIKPFEAHGGKLVIYHGWADPTVAPIDTVRYYKNVGAYLKNPSDTARLFMVPGMTHCGGGPGPHTFDAFGALVAWVEHKQAPEKIVTSNAAFNPGIGAANQISEAPVQGQPSRSRLLCPYPQTAQYIGKGSTDDASSFVCQVPKSN